MLTWGAFHIIGGAEDNRDRLAKDQQELLRRVRGEIDSLAVETDVTVGEPRCFFTV